VSRWQRFTRALPLGLALSMTASVWLAGAVWSFEEQTRFADSRGFAVPELLPLVLDGLAVALAGVAYAASLDGRAAVQARLGTALAVASSAASNGAWAWSRTSGDAGAVVLAAGVPVAANLAFEVLLAELRRQVHRRRGLPAPVAVPGPRLLRLALAPVTASREWRALVLALTAPAASATPVPDSVGAPWVSRNPELHGSDDTGEGPLPRPVKRAAASRASAHPSATARDVDLPDELVAVGRQVADELAAAGTTLTHRSLMGEFRARDLSLSAQRCSALLRLLKPA
jgi:hypothetical protein